ncbi:MAG: tandem-95 repeat protein [Flavobacteriales bacterium]|nr:tandem-95 repeat protein [Flavobacteriales bacterium]
MNRLSILAISALCSLFFPCTAQAQVAVDDSLSTDEDVPVLVDVAVNDTLSGMPPFSFTLLSGPLFGELIVFTDGLFSYSPDAQFNGIDSFSYLLCGADLVCDTGVVVVNILPVYDPPVAVDDLFEMEEESYFNGDIALNDLNADGGPVTYTAISSPSNGNIMWSGDHQFAYWGFEDFEGTDGFDYVVCDAFDVCDTAHVFLMVLDANDPPVTATDNFTVSEDQVLEGDVAFNDSDEDSPELYYSIIDPPAHGSVTMNGNGTFTYYSNYGYNGTDEFGYIACDAWFDALCDANTVNIQIEPVNDPPSAYVYLAAKACKGGVYVGDLVPLNTDVDGDAISLVDATCSAGTISYLPDGTFELIVPADQEESISIEFSVCDDGDPVLCNDGDVDINVASGDLEISSNTTYSASCDGQMDGCIFLSFTGGVGPYSYLWDSGAAQPNLYNVGPGEYEITVTDLGGCAPAESFVITVEAETHLEAEYSVTEIDCEALTADVLVEVSGGTPPYLFEWSDGNVGNTAYELDEGIYSVEISDGPCDIEIEIDLSDLGCPDTSMATMPFIPEGFSPNGDGINDQFEIELNPASGPYVLSIWDEQGNTCFKSTDFTGTWNGINERSGNRYPPGTYYYRFATAQGMEQTGFIIIQYQP